VSKRSSGNREQQHEQDRTNNVITANVRVTIEPAISLALSGAKPRSTAKTFGATATLKNKAA
jgi:hypothetical protein